MTQHAIHWFEIFVSDFNRAVRFYQTVLNVEMRRMEEAGRPMALFQSATASGVGGCLAHRPDRKPADQGTLVYLDADGKLDACLARVERAGGAVVQPKTDITPHGFIALVRDPEGNLVGLHST